MPLYVEVTTNSLELTERAVPITGASFLHGQQVLFVLALFEAMTLKRHLVGLEWKRWQLLHLAWTSFFSENVFIHLWGDGQRERKSS